MSRNISKIIKKVKSSIKALFFDISDPKFMIGFLSTFKLASNSSRIYEKTTMRDLPFLVKNALGTTLNSRISAATHTTPVVASVNKVEPTTQKKLLCSYLEIVNCFLKEFANTHAIAKTHFAILRYMQPAHITYKHYADNLYAKSCNMADVYDESTIADIFIDKVDSSVSDRLHEYCATHLCADVSDFVFKAQSLLEIQKGSMKPASSCSQAARSKPFARCNWIGRPQTL